MKRKVVLFIVEGPTDGAALNSVFKAFFQQPSHRFQIVFGDITSDWNSKPSNIKRKVNDIIKDFINRYRYSKKDISQVIQLVDTDGAFIPDEKIIFSPETHLN